MNNKISLLLKLPAIHICSQLGGLLFQLSHRDDSIRIKLPRWRTVAAVYIKKTRAHTYIADASQVFPVVSALGRLDLISRRCRPTRASDQFIVPVILFLDASFEIIGLRVISWLLMAQMKMEVSEDENISINLASKLRVHVIYRIANICSVSEMGCTVGEMLFSHTYICVGKQMVAC